MMIRNADLAVGLALLLAAACAAPLASLGQNVTTRQYDNARSGVQSHETELTPSNVNSSSFGKVFSFPVNGHVYPQPLYVGGLTMSDGNVHNVLFVATEQDYVYAFDADGKNPAQGYLWMDSLPGAGETWVSSNDVNSGDIYPDIGITGTPVIDTTRGVLYVVAKSKTTSAPTQFFQRLHALSLTDGTEKLNGPTEIQATVPGTGGGGTTISFDPLLENQRAGLLLTSTPAGSSPSSVFIAWASHGDSGAYHGWVISYDSDNISHQTGAWSDTPNGALGGIWMSGGALSSDDAGNIFAADGNGTFDGDTGGGDYGDSVVSLSLNGSSLAATGYFTPYNQNYLKTSDNDLGVSSVVLLPTQTGAAIPHLAVTGDKTGTIYLVNRDNLGGYSATTNTSAQSFNDGGYTDLDSPAFFNNTMYLAPEAGPLSAWAFNPDTELFTTTPFTASSEKFGCKYCGGAGATPVVSANGASDAIVWMLDDSSREVGPAVLRAYDPANLRTEYYNSAQAPNHRDAAAIAVKFTTPVVANGRVYVGGVNAVTVYGEIPPVPTVTISASPTSIAAGGSSTLTVTAMDSAQAIVTGSDGSSYTLPPAGGAQTVSPMATTTYTATATGSGETMAGRGQTATAAATVTVVSNTSCLPSGPGAVICQPSSGATVGSPVTISAGAIAQRGSLVGLRIYIDNQAVYTGYNPSQSNSYQISQTLTVSAGSHHLAVVGYQSSGGIVKTAENFTVGSGGGGGGTICYPASAGAMICAPGTNATVGSPVSLFAGATAGSGYIAAVRVYVDNAAVYTENNPTQSKSYQITHALNLSSGSHYLVILGYQSAGGTVEAAENFTVSGGGGGGGGGGGTTCNPTSAGAMFCAPSQNATVGSPVQIFAGATAASGSIAAIRVYLDNQAQQTYNNSANSKSFTINAPLSFPTGTHSLVIVGYQSAGGTQKASETITVR